jgi:hypothetical protein
VHAGRLGKRRRFVMSPTDVHQKCVERFIVKGSDPERAMPFAEYGALR